MYSSHKWYAKTEAINQRLVTKFTAKGEENKLFKRNQVTTGYCCERLLCILTTSDMEKTEATY